MTTAMFIAEGLARLVASLVIALTILGALHLAREAHREGMRRVRKGVSR